MRNTNNETVDVIIFQKTLKQRDVEKRLQVPVEDAKNFEHLRKPDNKIDFYEEGGSGKKWSFKYSYWESEKSDVFIGDWKKFAKENGLRCGDIVYFKRHQSCTNGFVISWSRPEGKSNAAMLQPSSDHDSGQPGENGEHLLPTANNTSSDVPRSSVPASIIVTTSCSPLAPFPNAFASVCPISGTNNLQASPNCFEQINNAEGICADYGQFGFNQYSTGNGEQVLQPEAYTSLDAHRSVLAGIGVNTSYYPWHLGLPENMSGTTNNCLQAVPDVFEQTNSDEGICADNQFGYNHSTGNGEHLLSMDAPIISFPFPETFTGGGPVYPQNLEVQDNFRSGTMIDLASSKVLEQIHSAEGICADYDPSKFNQFPTASSLADLSSSNNQRFDNASVLGDHIMTKKPEHDDRQSYYEHYLKWDQGLEPQLNFSNNTDHFNNFMKESVGSIVKILEYTPVKGATEEDRSELRKYWNHISLYKQIKVPVLKKWVENVLRGPNRVETVRKQVSEAQMNLRNIKKNIKSNKLLLSNLKRKAEEERSIIADGNVRIKSLNESTTWLEFAQRNEDNS